MWDFHELSFELVGQILQLAENIEKGDCHSDCEELHGNYLQSDKELIECHTDVFDG